jgi:carbon-monoxide dehydrogenase medium subunit
MLLAEVEYARPETVDEAVRLLSSRDDARVLAGGQSLINVMKVRVASPEVVVDIGRIAELRGVRRTDAGLELGAGTTYSDLIGSDDVRAVRPLLADVALRIADVQVRNRGTIGGNICSNDPTNHFPPVLAAIGASMTIRSLEGERTVGAEEFFEGVFMTAVTPGELLTKVTVPPNDGGDGFASVTIGKDGTGIVNVAAHVAGGNARIAIGCVAATPIVLTAAADEVAVKDAVQSAGLDPPSDVHASADYRRHVAAVCAVRALREALA